MRFRHSLLAASLLFSAIPAVAATWKIDSSHSTANFKVKHLMVSNVNGTITGIEGAVELDDKDVTKSKVNATLDAASVNTRNEKRDEHLRSPDFFNTKKNPKITFVSSSVTKVSEGKLKVNGDLTLNGVTKPVVLDVDGPTPAIKSPFGDMRRGVSATTKIDRKDFGITWNKSLDDKSIVGGVVVGDEISIDLELELISGGK